MGGLRVSAFWSRELLSRFIGAHGGTDKETTSTVSGLELRIMDDNFRMFLYMAQHDPAVVVGLASIGAASTLFFHMTLKLSRVGFRSYVVFKPPFVLAGNWAIPGEYLKVRRKYG